MTPAMTDTMDDERAIARLRGLAASVLPDGDQAAWEAINYLADRLAQQPTMAPALDVFKIAGGDVECSPEPTAEMALDCLRDLRQCYEEVLSQQPAAALPEVTDAEVEALVAALRVLVDNGGIGPESMFHDARDALIPFTGAKS